MENITAMMKLRLRKRADLMSEVNDLAVAINLHYTIDASKEDQVRLAKSKESVPKPTWKNVADILVKIHQRLGDDRYSSEQKNNF